MQKAIRLAEIALSNDEVPVGALIIKNEKIWSELIPKEKLII